MFPIHHCVSNILQSEFHIHSFSFANEDRFFTDYSALVLLSSSPQDLQKFPRIQVKLNVKRREIGGTNSTVVNIRLEKVNSRSKTSRAFTPRFPKVEYSSVFCTQFNWQIVTLNNLLTGKGWSMVVDFGKCNHVRVIYTEESELL